MILNCVKTMRLLAVDNSNIIGKHIFRAEKNARARREACTGIIGFFFALNMQISDDSWSLPSSRA